MRRVIFGRMRSETAFVPILESAHSEFIFSTRSGNIMVNRGDGSAEFFYSSPKNRDFTYGFVFGGFPSGVLEVYSFSSVYTGNAYFKFLKGLKDVYSMALFQNTTNTSFKYNINDIESFFGQFPNLYSVIINNNSSGDPLRTSVINGDFAKMPNSLEILVTVTVYTKAGTDFYLNVSNYSTLSKIKKIDLLSMKIYGDLGNLPTSCNFFRLVNINKESNLIYTAGKVWASSFDTLSLPISLTTVEIDNLISDMASSVTSAVGNKLISVLGVRSSISDTPTYYLQSKNFSVIIDKKKVILDLKFQNNFTDDSENALGIIAANSNGLPSFVAGRKGIDYAVKFENQKSLKTAINLPNKSSDKISIAFWIKTTQTSVNSIVELTPAHWSNVNSYALYMNDTAAGKIDLRDLGPGSLLNTVQSPVINNGNWFHLVFTLDRALGINQSKVYLNKTLNFTQRTAAYNDNFGRFMEAVLFIGQRGGSSIPFVGELAYLKMWNYAITQEEVDNHYNETL